MNNVLKVNQLPPINLEDYKQNFCFPIQNYWRGLGFRFTNKTFNTLNELFINEYQKKMFLPKIHNHLIGFLKKLNHQKIQQFILSASEQKILTQSIKHYNLQSFFKGIYGVDNLNAVGKQKRGEQLCINYKFKRENTLLIGDTEYDKEVALYLGCRILLVSYGHINHQRLLKTGETVVSSVRELKSFLRSI